MRTGLIAKKLGMSSKFTAEGKRLTLTFLHIDNCQVVGQKTIDRDGYNAVVIGAVLKKPYKVSKSMKKVFANAKVEPKTKLKEFRVSENHMLDVGLELKPTHFEIGQFVDVSGTSIGKGFAGVMKRHNFRGLEASHGVSISHRSHGSTGQCQDPGKVFKGKKMAGHLGDVRVTVQNLKVVDLDIEKGLLIVSGNVPGSKGSYIYVKDAVKKSASN
ncbi:MAG: 50S ribosomal protein L3 [Rickettsiaceae bacterium]|jgi:large subunit ribosomal protein L3|nr:50S ribosomal protein L3 [Candidatus Megaera polyxenophila]MBP9777927.1 50S ribosomal protein L3 [Rickettsiaceae bacterium]NDA89911.1 50S ribosomal protein L3 [Alphaproteobacteria bacterium]UCM93590.1 MAG: 50S ribosomal protein L3 [Candidatus Megaira endosymbiont of Mesostigma viride]HJK85116.1 50S ribosomal protein L3 [Candidatus Megaera endosymbiont of Stentor roeselii]MCC8461436.1 50S ribosomal protein L3 [Candidatus Megaera polyxenophila]